jgi:predicted  nucleic acid-binding Zn-ribbon protein
MSTSQSESELFRLRMEHTRINDRLSTLKAEAEALLAQRSPIEKRIAELEDAT